MDSDEFQVLIVDEGRAGSVEYVEGCMKLPLWWEFTMNGAYIWAPSEEHWDSYWSSHGAGGAVGRREEILQRVASEAIRKRAPDAKSSVDDEGVHIKF